ncbi:MAG: hypothetical protein ACI9H1_001543 [Polaribacter sp.]|jgi:hypothetical protein|tara:strand:- start:42 stop:524 length:483 start_codon:yes stop_codon:yes gene_type:complete
MKIKLHLLFLLFPLIINSQSLKRIDLIGNWKVKEYIMKKDFPKDTIINLGGGIFIEYGKTTEPKSFDIEITKNTIKEGTLESNFWKISNYEILARSPIPKDKLKYYQKYTFGVIEKLENGKYYFTNTTYTWKVLSINKNELVIDSGEYYNTIYERKKNVR